MIAKAVPNETRERCAAHLLYWVRVKKYDCWRPTIPVLSVAIFDTAHVLNCGSLKHLRIRGAG